jgi:hypothetical protein
MLPSHIAETRTAACKELPAGSGRVVNLTNPWLAAGKIRFPTSRPIATERVSAWALLDGWIYMPFHPLPIMLIN